MKLEDREDLARRAGYNSWACAVCDLGLEDEPVAEIVAVLQDMIDHEKRN